MWLQAHTRNWRKPLFWIEDVDMKQHVVKFVAKIWESLSGQVNKYKDCSMSFLFGLGFARHLWTILQLWLQQCLTTRSHGLSSFTPSSALNSGCQVYLNGYHGDTRPVLCEFDCGSSSSWAGFFGQIHPDFISMRALQSCFQKLIQHVNGVKIHPNSCWLKSDRYL